MSLSKSVHRVPISGLLHQTTRFFTSSADQRTVGTRSKHCGYRRALIRRAGDPGDVFEALWPVFGTGKYQGNGPSGAPEKLKIGEKSKKSLKSEISKHC